MLAVFDFSPHAYKPSLLIVFTDDGRMARMSHCDGEPFEKLVEWINAETAPGTDVTHAVSVFHPPLFVTTIERTMKNYNRSDVVVLKAIGEPGPAADVDVCIRVATKALAIIRQSSL